MLRLQRAGRSAVKIVCLLQKLYHVDLRSQLFAGKSCVMGGS